MSWTVEVDGRRVRGWAAVAAIVLVVALWTIVVLLLWFVVASPWLILFKVIGWL